MKRLKCVNCYKTIRVYKSPIKHKNGMYTYDYRFPRFCPYCGNMMSNYRQYTLDIFKVYDLNKKLIQARNLILKSEYESACRECFVVLENTIKKESGIKGLHGSELVTKAFSYKYDKETLAITQAPLIAINDLSNESELNEQDGVMHMLMGFFRGPRNIYQHNEVRLGFNISFSILIETSFFLDIIVGKHSLLSKPHWVKVKIKDTPESMYQKMPKLCDRIAFKWECIKRGQYRILRIKGRYSN